MFGLLLPIVVIGLFIVGLTQYRDRTVSGARRATAVTGAAGEPAPLSPEQTRRRPPALAEVLGYVGAVLAMAGVVQLVARTWDSFEQPVRISLLGGLSAVLLAAGLWLRHEDEAMIWRLRGFLLLLSTLSLAGCAGIAFVDSLDMEGEPVTIGIGLVVAAYSGLLWMFRDRPAQQATTFAGIVLAAGGAMAVVDGSGAVGLTMVGLGAAWIGVGFAARRTLRSETTLLGLVALLIGPAVTFESFREVSPAIGIAVAVVVIVLGARADEFVITGTGVLALMAYVPFAIAQWFGDALEAAGVLVVSGLILIGVTLVMIKRRGPGEHVSGGTTQHQYKTTATRP